MGELAGFNLGLDIAGESGFWWWFFLKCKNRVENRVNGGGNGVYGAETGFLGSGGAKRRVKICKNL